MSSENNESMLSEKTPLADSNLYGGRQSNILLNVREYHMFDMRRKKQRQLQGIMIFTFTVSLIMALILTVHYEMNKTYITHLTSHSSLLENRSRSSEQRKRVFKTRQTNTQNLSLKEIQLSISTGNAAIAARYAANAASKSIPPLSPSWQHQFAMSTSPWIADLSFAAVAEIAATRKIEELRSSEKKSTCFGNFLDGGWMSQYQCPGEIMEKCEFGLRKYRNFDGSCNHLYGLGRALMPYRRSIPPDYSDRLESPRNGKLGYALPSAREVSLTVHSSSPTLNPNFTVMLAVYGQFLDHDITATALSQGMNGTSISCCNVKDIHPECFPVKIGAGDPAYNIGGRSCMEFVRSAPAAQCKMGPRQQINQVTSFIDGSAIYGSNLLTALELREYSGGLLRMQITPDKRQLLPASMNLNDGCNRKVEYARGRYCFTTGDARANENLHLTTMHLLWARQHNFVANQLTKINRNWDDEQVYQESRRIIGAQLQHITYNEFLPVILGEQEIIRHKLKLLNNGFRLRRDIYIDPTIANNFAAAAFRFAHTLLPGLMKVIDKQKKTSAYIELHKILFNPYSLYSKDGIENSINIAISNTIQKTTTHVTSQLTSHLFEDPIGNRSSIPCGLDLVSLNIQRGRDHGLPGYTKWREFCGLQKPLKFQDLKDDFDLEALEAISKLYSDVDDIDLYTGALAEIPTGDGLLGPTFKCLIADQFVRLQLGDKYWYEFSDQPGSFTKEQLQELRKTSLSRIICDNSDGITEIQIQVMRSSGPDNPVVPCKHIPQLLLDVWKEENI